MMSKKKTFETSLSELESIILELESGSSSLDKMIILFEDGMKLMSLCREQLNEVENRVTTLIKENNKFINKVEIDQSEYTNESS